MSPAQTLVNTVNTVGVMGKGIAKDFKKYYPEMFDKYYYLCQGKRLNVGQLMLTKGEPEVYHNKRTGKFRRRWVLNFPTKKHWRGKSNIEYIESGLKKFVEVYEMKDIKSVSFPQLGIRNGGLNWSEVQELMETYLSKVNIPVYIHIFQPKSDRNNKYYSDKIKLNLNTEHDAWRKNTVLNLARLKENNKINCDGIILPGSDVYNKVIDFENFKKLPVIKQDNANLIWLTENTKKKQQKNSQQLNLF